MKNRTKREKKVKRKINKSVKRKKMSRFQRTRKKQGGGEFKLVNDTGVANRPSDVIPIPVNNLSDFTTVNNRTKIDLHRSYISPFPPPVLPPVLPPVPPPVLPPVLPPAPPSVPPSNSNQVLQSSEEIIKIVETLNMLLNNCYDYYKFHKKSAFTRFMNKNYDMFHNPRTNMMNVCKITNISKNCIDGESDESLLSKLYGFINKNTEDKRKINRLKRICTYVDKLVGEQYENTHHFFLKLKDSFKSFFFNYQSERHHNKRENEYIHGEANHNGIYDKVRYNIDRDGLFKLLIKFKEVIDFEKKIEKEKEKEEEEENDE